MIEKNLDVFSKEIRIALLEQFKASKGGHLGGSLSLVELCAVLYGKQCRYNEKDPLWDKRDYVILSKGHAGPVLYATLALSGFFDKAELQTLNQGGTNLPSHPDRLKVKGVDVTTGSLGQGLSIAAGITWDIQMKNSNQYVYVIVGDGELNEGQNWEAMSFIAHHNLNQCILFIDDNKKQLDGFTVDINHPQSIHDKVSSFGFQVIDVNGHDCREIDEAITLAKKTSDKPTCILLDTVKGKGIPQIENLMANHSVKLNEDDLWVDEVISTWKKEVGGNQDV